MKQVFHKIMSVLMAFVVLFATTSFTIDMHYCGDHLVETAILHKAKGCGMEMQKPAPSSDCEISKKNCCTDQQIVVDGQDELQQSVEKISFEQQLIAASFVYVYASLFGTLEEKAPSYKHYRPPLVIRQIYKLDETYLI